MFISEEEMKRRLESGRNLANKFVPATFTSVGAKTPSVPKPKPLPAPVTPSPSDVSAPIEIGHEKGLHVIAGTLVRQGEKPTVVAKELGLPVKVVKQAAHSSDKEIAARVEATTDKIREMALDKMLISLGLMTPDKFIDTPLKDLSAIAANCAKVIEKITPRDNTGPQVQLVVYAPQQREERSYKVVDI